MVLYQKKKENEADKLIENGWTIKSNLSIN